MPELVMVCGPNGAGKSTLTRTLVVEQNFICIDPDALAANGLSPLAAGKAAASMAKLMLEQGVSFVRESTLTSHFDFHLMEAAKARGYKVRLVYIMLRSAELALSRVRSRVKKGGHDVPDEDIVQKPKPWQILILSLITPIRDTRLWKPQISTEPDTNMTLRERGNLLPLFCLNSEG